MANTNAKAGNAVLQAAKNAKNDEFYTYESDVAAEVEKYADEFRGKRVVCNCNDGHDSAFTKFFTENFKRLGLRSLVAFSYNPDGNAELVYSIESGDISGAITMEENGDFMGKEAIDILRASDIVCTNPPFSRFRDFIELLVKEQKKFLVIGNKNAISYKGVFPLIKDGLMHTGYNNVKTFRQPDGSVKTFGNIGWFTNLGGGSDRSCR